MAETSGFFNSVGGDRKYTADFFSQYFADFISNGVYPNPSTMCQIIANGNMTVTEKAGNAYINGMKYKNDGDNILTIDIADGVLKRIDRVVLRHTVLNREIKAYVKKGTFASTPVAPTLQRDADAYELGLADIYIAAGATSISQANITDLRLNNTYCGIVHGVIDQVDTTTLFNQYQDWYKDTTGRAQVDIADLYEKFANDFNAWFTSVKDTLSTDAAGNLLNLINTNAANIASLQKIQNAGGTATAITLTGVTLTDGFQASFVISSNNNAAPTTINTKPLYKPGTTTAPKLVAGKAATVWYNAAGGCFFVKASAEGTAVADDVLAGQTFSNDDDTGIVGTLALTGTAGTADVVIGKTFYSTDAKTQLTGVYSNIKSIQRGVTYIPGGATSTTVTIAAVDTTKTIARLTNGFGQSNNSNESFVSYQSTAAVIPNATTLNLERSRGQCPAYTVFWEVIEFNNVKSLQRGTATGNANIASINPAKSILFFYRASFSSSAHVFLYNGRLESATKLVFEGSYMEYGVKWQVIEFN